MTKKSDPNVQRHKLYSEILGTSISLRVTPRILRTVDKYGGMLVGLSSMSGRDCVG